MADVRTPEQRRYNMRRIRGKDTKPELVVRRAIHAAGLRFRLHRCDLPGTPDLVFPKHRTCLFVNGCFGHGHNCSLFRLPATRTAFWAGKINKTKERDEAAIESLLAAGWSIMVVWECRLKLEAKQGHDEFMTFLCNTIQQIGKKQVPVLMEFGA